MGHEKYVSDYKILVRLSMGSSERNTSGKKGPGRKCGVGEI
jgi:hypothetical protein